LKELAARTIWNSHLYKHIPSCIDVNFKPVNLKLVHIEEVDPSTSMTAQLAAFDEDAFEADSETKILPIVNRLHAPVAIKQFMSGATLCHLCLEAFVGPAVVFIDEITLKHPVTPATVPIKYTFCSGQCAEDFQTRGYYITKTMTTSATTSKKHRGLSSMMEKLQSKTMTVPGTSERRSNALLFAQRSTKRSVKRGLAWYTYVVADFRSRYPHLTRATESSSNSWFMPRALVDAVNIDQGDEDEVVPRVDNF
jgi:hypothetical protein